MDSSDWFCDVSLWARSLRRGETGLWRRWWSGSLASITKMAAFHAVRRPGDEQLILPVFELPAGGDCYLAVPSDV